MGMRTYRPMRLAPTTDPLLKSDLQGVDVWLRQLSTYIARVPSGPQGTPSAGTSIDLSKYLFLPGRPFPGQRANGTNVFSCKTADEISATTNADYRGFTLETLNPSVGQYYIHRIYFSIETTGAAITRRWIFPVLAGNNTASIFVSTDGTQSITNKTILSSTIHVGSDANRNIFRDTTSGLKEFIITTASTFPTTAVSTPTLQLPGLDTSTNEHSFVILHSNASSPFPPGSIIYGNSAGSEMAALSNGTLGQVLSSGGGTAAPSWTTIGSSSATASFRDDLFNIYGSADATKRIFFEVDGLTTATDRTLAVPDVSATLILSQGTSAGQTIGTTSHASGTASSLAIEGPVIIGDNAASFGYTSGQALAIRENAVNGGVMISALYNVAALSGAATGTLTLSQIQTTGIFGYTSGSFQLFGFQFNPSITVPSGVTISVFAPINTDTTFGTTAGGTVTEWYGVRSLQRGPTSAGPTITTIASYYASPGNRASSPSLVAAFLATKHSTVTYGAGTITQMSALEVDTSFGASAQITTWSGLRIPTISGPGTIWGLDITGTMNNRIAGPISLFHTAAPAAGRFIEAIATQTTSSALAYNFNVLLSSLPATFTSQKGFEASVSGTISSTGGSGNITGLSGVVASGVPSGVTITNYIGNSMTVAPASIGGTISQLTAQALIVLGLSSASTVPTIVGLDISIASRATSVTDLSHLVFTQTGGLAITAAITNYRFIDLGATAIADDADVVNWTGIRIPDAPINPTGTIRGIAAGNILSHFAGNTRFGSTTAPAHFIDIAAGTTTVAPIRFTSGTNLTTPAAGAVEFDGTRLYVTNSTPTRKTVAYTDDSLPAVPGFSRIFAMMGG